MKVRRKELNGENFSPTVQQPMNQEKSDIPEHFQCHSWRKILQGAFLMRCCQKELCEECFREVKKKEECIFCKKEIDIEKECFPNIPVRKLVEEYWRKINAEMMKKKYHII